MKMIWCECENGHVRGYAAFNDALMTFEAASLDYLQTMDRLRKNKLCHCCGSGVRRVQASKETFQTTAEFMAAVRKRMPDDIEKVKREKTVQF